MRALALQQGTVAQGEQQATYGGSLTSNYAPPSLENKFLAQTSSLMPQPSSPLLNLAAQPSSCPALQPSSLSSTSSCLLSTPSLSHSLTSPLLSTENKLLQSYSSLSFPLTSVPNDSLLPTSLASSSLLNRLAHPPSFLPHVLGGEQKRGDGGDEGREETSETMQSCFEETSMTQSEEDDVLPVEEEIDAGTTMGLPLQETDLGSQDIGEALTIRQEEFPEVERTDDDIKEELKDKKYLLLNAVCCSLVNKNRPPGQKDWDSENSVWIRITNLAKDISVDDPQFLLKVAVYTRQQLNIRITANFLLALASNLPSTKPHVRRYFCAAVQLPSDWLEVVRIYSTCFSRSLPTCLKKAMTDKFKQFNEYQLAKYNTRKHRCKHNRKRRKAKKPTEEQLKQWSSLLRSNATILSKFLQVEGSKAVVEKKESEFSLKKMIKRLHIKEPAEHVMAILGRKYPADLKAFTRSGMKGKWDRERAGQRMKLKEPETWERLVSLEGNKAATWEKLIDNKSLPFMAMLRNLRNMITKGISPAHHKKILRRLVDKKQVIQSRQFPFRFLAAYKVIMELRTMASATVQALPSVKEILKGILKKIPKSRSFNRMDWDTTPRSRLRVTLGVPFIYRQYRTKKAQLLKASQKDYTVELLDRYRKALETAVQISCRYNVPPLPGRTIVLFSDYFSDENKKGEICLPPDPNKTTDEEEEETPRFGRRGRNQQKRDNLSASMMELAALLSLMIGSSAEDFQLCYIGWNSNVEIKLTSDNLLENVWSTMKQIKQHNDHSDDGEKESLLTTILKGQKVDNFIVVTDCYMNAIADWIIMHYIKDVNDKALVVKIFLGEKDPEYNANRNCVELSGFSEQILRFVGERGSARLLDHVEHMDKLYSIPPPEGAKGPQATSNVVPVPASPKLSWKGVRVFISSTFRDMHAERDILVRSVFPELRRRAASHCLYLQEVELRWGVTEEESGRATELCLSEVCRSQMLVGVLGERYGLVPPKPALPDLPQHSWLESAPAGLSITEMEIRQFQALYPETSHQRMFCYFRDPNISKSVPAAWRSDFVPESKEAESKMTSLKQRIRTSEVKITENYPCKWGGVVDGKPYLKNLENFGKAVLEDLWTAVEKLFVQEDDKAEAVFDVTEQEVHQGALQRQFFGRSKLLVGAMEIVERVQTKGGVMVVEGGPGEGKTVFMAALADALRTGIKSRTNFTCDVISYSTAASQSAHSVENLLRCFIQRLRKMKDTKEESPLPHSYKDLLSEFHSSLSEVKKNKPLVLLVDGVDLVRDSRGQPSSDWIPQEPLPGVCLVVSITTRAALLQTLTRKKSTILFSLGQLTMPDRKEIVQKGLDTFGKKLSDSAFNNQLQMLIMKKGAVSPLYLHLACEDLRNFASFDKLKQSLEGLPQSLSQLVQHSLDRLCSQYRGLPGLRWALGVFTVSTTVLRERDLYSILHTCNDLASQDGQVTWGEALNLSRKPKGRIPMATFMHIVLSLKSLIGSSHCHTTDESLTLTNPEVKRALEDFLLPTGSDRSKAHLVLAAHLWALADQEGTNTFFNCEANSVMHLPSSLIQSDQLEALRSLLSSYYFLYANVRHGLLHHIMETYSTYVDRLEGLQNCSDFLWRHNVLLSSCPSLFVQQALNEPPTTSAHTWAQGLRVKGGLRVVKWLNNDYQYLQETSQLVSTFSSEPTCLAVSSDGELMVVGTGQGMLHVVSTHTGQEQKSLVSSCDGISSCAFLKDGRFATTSYDGRIEIWDIENGCRTAVIDGHTNAITASDTTADRKHIVTVSLDCALKVWSSAKGKEVGFLLSNSPLNCVNFDPEDQLLAAGCWDGSVIVWNWLQNKTETNLTGHQTSVRSLSFSSSSMLCSGSVSGEVRVWSVPTSTCVGCFQAHSGAADILTFVDDEDDGKVLLSAGSDHLIQVWSGGLGRSVKALKSDECEREPPLKKRKTVKSKPAALCVAVNGGFAAVGYHGEGIKLFNIDSAEQIWVPDHLDVSVSCLLWLVVNEEQTEPELVKEQTEPELVKEQTEPELVKEQTEPELVKEQTEPELLVSAGSDKRLRVWKSIKGEEGMLGGLEMLGVFSAQTAVILALAQNSKYLATASDDCTIALWLLSDLADSVNPSVEPNTVLRGHNGGVTCLAFSPDGEQLLSGGKDQALMVWDMNVNPAVLSKSLPHSHKDWITGCVWTSDCVISSSNDGRLCLWDLQAGQRLKEISWKSPLTSVCCLGRYVITSCSEGSLHVWNWETSTEICHVAAHEQRIHHCSLLPNTDENKEVNPEEMTVLTASDDGTVHLWKPLQMDHFRTLQGHSGPICGVVRKEGLPDFLSLSADCSVRCWSWTSEGDPIQKGPVTALSFSQNGNLLIVGYKVGLLELWQNNALIGHKQLSDSLILAACSMPDDQFAVSYMKPVVDVWKVVWNQQHTTASLVKVNTFKVEEPMIRLQFCLALLGITQSGAIQSIRDSVENKWDFIIHSWHHSVRVLSMIRSDLKSMWLVGECENQIKVGFIFAMGPKYRLNSAMSTMDINVDEEEEKSSMMTAATMDKDLIVCGDMKGSMWFIQPPEPSTWKNRISAHSDRISVLKLTDTTIISASRDNTVKLWDRNTKKLVGMFMCRGPVVHLEVNPEKPTELVCGDRQGKLYFLSWKEYE